MKHLEFGKASLGMEANLCLWVGICMHTAVHSAMNALSSVSVEVLLCYVFLCLSLSGI